MTDEEYLRNRLDRLNQNSHYGIMIDTEITDIVRSHIKRLEETKMNATSTEEFKDIIAIDFELHTFPNPDVQDKFIVSATNRDDIFAFVFEGPNIVDTCRKTGLFAGWEKDQKIRELEKELHSLKLKKTNLPETPITDAMLVDDYNRLVEENKQLKQENLKFRDEAAERRFNEKLHDFEVNNKKYDGKIMEEILKRNSGRYPWDEKPSDNVNHPSHYTGRYECIDVMQDVFGDEATDNFCLCNAFKYIWRARKKNGLEDVKKAVWYLNKYIEEAEKDGVPKGK